MSFDLILPFLRPIAHPIEDPGVSEIMVNGSRRIFVERQGLVREEPGRDHADDPQVPDAVLGSHPGRGHNT